MFVTYMFCKAYESYANEPEPNLPAGFVIATDDVRELNELDYTLNGTECLWIVPGTYTE